MRYTFLSAHCVQGIAHPVGEPDVVLFNDPAKSIRVLLTSDAVPHLHLLNRHLALLSMMLRAMIGNPLAGDFPDLLSEEQKAHIATDIALALKAGAIERVMRLHAQSLNKATDNYRAFVAAWSALEILIGKLFPVYQRLLAEELRAVNQSPGLHAYLDRVASVMGDKYNLADKFAVLTVYLDDARGEDEVRIFRELKRVRDALSHGEDVEEAALPTKDVQRLFDKYLRNHLRRDA